MAHEQRPIYLMHEGDCYKAYLDENNQFDYVETFIANTNLHGDTMQWGEVPDVLKNKFEDLRIRRREAPTEEPPSVEDEAMDGLEQ